MPLIDMPLEKLKTYQGVNPRPADFDAFWEKALAELDTVDPQPRMERIEMYAAQFDCYHLYFKSTKNAEIHAHFVRPKQIEGKVPAILQFHGLSGDCGSVRDLFIYASQGYCVAAMDCRGQGGLSQDVGGMRGTTYSTPFARSIEGDPHDLYYRDVYLDTVQFARVIMNLPYVDADRVGVCGGSQGGGLSLACAALVPQIKRCAAHFPYLCDYRRVWEMDLDRGAYEGLHYYFRHFDPRHEREEEIFTRLGYIDVQFLAPRIRAKVLMATGLMDTTCPPSTQFAAFNKITSEKEVVIYPDFGHEGLKGQADIDFRFLAQL